MLPSYAAWFRLDAVHPIERRALPKILSDSDEATAAYVSTRPPLRLSTNHSISWCTLGESSSFTKAAIISPCLRKG